jgi:hydrogenase maturation factor
MCLALPYKVVSKKQNEIKLDFFGKQYIAKNSLIKIKPGDFVLVQKDTIIKKLPKREAKEILKLVSKK